MHRGARCNSVRWILHPRCTMVQVHGDPNEPSLGAGAAGAPCVTLSRMSRCVGACAALMTNCWRLSCKSEYKGSGCEPWRCSYSRGCERGSTRRGMLFVLFTHPNKVIPAARWRRFNPRGTGPDEPPLDRRERPSNDHIVRSRHGTSPENPQYPSKIGV